MRLRRNTALVILLTSFIVGSILIGFEHMKKKYIYKFITYRLEDYVQKKWNSDIHIGRISGNVFTHLKLENVVLTDIKGYPKDLRIKADSVILSYSPFSLLWRKFNADFKGVEMKYKNMILPLGIKHRFSLTTVTFKKQLYNLEDLKDLLPKNIALAGMTEMSGKVILRRFRPYILDVLINSKDCQVRCGTSLEADGFVNIRMKGPVSQLSISGMVEISELSLPGELAGLSIFKVLRVNLRSGFLKRADLNINIQGKGVIVRNHYVNAPVNIYLKLKKEINDEPYLLGKIEIFKGSYEAYDNQFKINKGEIAFTNKDKSPLIDVEAETKVRRYKIFVKVKGNLESSRLTLTSKPELSYPEIVSLIAFGKNVNELTSTQKKLLTASDFNNIFINCLFMGKAETKIAKVIGLDEINLRFDTSSNDLKVIKSPSMEIGKSIIDEKVYGTYAINPSNSSGGFPEQAVGSEIELTEHIKLKGQRTWRESWQLPKEDKVSIEFKWKY